jgi:hypothetical protein
MRGRLPRGAPEPTIRMDRPGKGNTLKPTDASLVRRLPCPVRRRERLVRVGSGVPDNHNMDPACNRHASASSVREQCVLAYYTCYCAMDWKSDELVELHPMEHLSVGKMCIDGCVP